MLPYLNTLNMALAAGYSIPLPGDGAQALKLKARAECYVKPVYGPQTSAPAAPGATPAPGAGAQAVGWKHLLSTDNPVEVSGEDGPDGTRITYLLVWGTAAGMLEIEGY